MEHKTRKHGIRKKLGAAILLLAFVSGMHVSYAQQNDGGSMRVYAEDTIAGYGTKITGAALAPHSDLNVELKKPQGTTIALPAKSDDRGNFTLDVSSFHTQKSGMYKVTAKAAKQQVETTFQVFADKPASTLSRVTANKKMAAANGSDTALVTVELKDGFGNPVEKHRLALISSRPEDAISLESKYTETGPDGMLVFKVSSSKEGLATLTAMDMTINAAVGERETVLFANDVTVSKGSTTVMKPSQLQASLLAQTSTTTLGSTATRLRVRTEPVNRVAVGDYYNITVEVLTQDGQPATDYRGTLLFTSTDANAELPLRSTGYQFNGAEQPAATKVFSQAARFLSSGEKTVEIVDRDNISLSASYVLTAFDRAGGGTAATTPIVISRPQAGILTTQTVTVEGTATPFQELRIYDNGVEAAKTTADAQGIFTGEITNLTDGTHRVEVKAVDSGGNVTATSEAVTVSLRSNAPVVKGLTYEPAGGSYTPGQKVKVLVMADAGLGRVIYALNNTPFQLEANPAVSGQYEAEITVPAQPGIYDATVQLENSFGITGEQAYPATFTVTEALLNVDAATYEALSPTTINITWPAPQTLSATEKYRIAYGTSATALDQIKDLPSTSPYLLSDLTSNTTYYMQFQAVNTANEVLRQSSAKAVTTPEAVAITNAQAMNADGKLAVSWTMSGAKSQLARFRILYGVSPESYTNEQYAESTATSILLDALVDGTVHYVRVQALGQNGEPLVQSSEFFGTPSTMRESAPVVCQPADVQNLRVVIIDEKKYLEWDAAHQAEGYKVFMGTQEGSYSSSNVVQGTRYAIPELDKDTKHYYFAVSAMCDGRESLSLSRAVRVESGPLLWAGIAGLLALAGAGVHMHRRRTRVV